MPGGAVHSIAWGQLVDAHGVHPVSPFAFRLQPGGGGIVLLALIRMALGESGAGPLQVSSPKRSQRCGDVSHTPTNPALCSSHLAPLVDPWSHV
jgi:hypothetical protein